MSVTNENSLTFRIGGEIKINRVGYGGMQLTGHGVWGDAPDREKAKEVLKATVASGVNFIDTADSYGPHTNEVLISEALHPYKDDLLIATKGGFDRTGPNQWVVNGNPEHIREAIEGSLKRLKLDRIDLWQLHRFDPKFPIEETLAPVAEAVKAGKILHVGYCRKLVLNKSKVPKKYCLLFPSKTFTTLATVNGKRSWIIRKSGEWPLFPGTRWRLARTR